MVWVGSYNLVSQGKLEKYVIELIVTQLAQNDDALKVAGHCGITSSLIGFGSVCLCIR